MLNISDWKGSVKRIAQWQQACFHTHNRRARLHCLQRTGNLFPMTSNKHEVSQTTLASLAAPILISPERFYCSSLWCECHSSVSGTSHDHTIDQPRTYSESRRGLIFTVNVKSTRTTCEDNAETRCNHQNERGCTSIIWNFKTHVNFLCANAIAWRLHRPFYGRSNQHNISSNLTNSAHTMRQIVQKLRWQHL